MRQWIRLITLMVISVGVSACVPSYGPGFDPNSIEGEWVDPNGLVSSFNAGRFETRTTDSNSLVATGSYSYVGRNLVQIRIRSLLRQTNSQANCSLVGPTRLNCTSNVGSQFTLNRRLV